jgi:hypothetical protein
MRTEQPPVPPDLELDDETEDAHEFGVFLHQVEGEIPLLAEDGDDDAA